MADVLMFLLKGHKNLLIVFLFYSASCVADLKLQPDSRTVLIHLGYPQDNTSSLRCKFQRIGEQIHENLVDPQRIPEQLLFHIAQKDHIEIQPLISGLPAYDIADRLQKQPEVKHISLYLDSSALDFRHVENIVDQRQKVAGGEIDFSDAVLHTAAVAEILHGNHSHSDNSVHRRAYLMGHAGKKFALCSVRLLSLLDGSLQLLLGRQNLRLIRQNCDEAILPLCPYPVGLQQENPLPGQGRMTVMKGTAPVALPHCVKDPLYLFSVLLIHIFKQNRRGNLLRIRFKAQNSPGIF